MYARRAALAFKSLLHISKVHRTRASEYIYPGNFTCFVRSFSTATERTDIYGSFDGNMGDNRSDNLSVNHSDGFYGRNFGGVELGQNPSGVYGQCGDFGGDRWHSHGKVDGSSVENRFGYGLGDRNNGFNSGIEQRQNNGAVHGQNFGGGYCNFSSGDDANAPRSVVAQKVENVNGFTFGGASRNLAGGFGGNAPMLQKNYGGGNEEMLQGNVHNSGIYQQNGGGHYYSNPGNFQQGWVVPSSSGINGTHLAAQSYVESSDVYEGSQMRKKVEDLDELIKEGKVKEAVELLGGILTEGELVDLPRFLDLMRLCGEKEALTEAKSVHEHLLKSVPDLEIRTYNKILDMYSKCRSMDDALAVFNQMPQRNLTSWDVMISGLAKNDRGEESIELFEEFKRSGLKPDGLLFLGLFSACGGLCDVIKGMLHFESMRKDYGVIPTMEHYVGVVDMLGTAGFLDEAFEFIGKMPIEPSVEIWETLMKFCRIHGITDLGDRCAGFVQLMDPSRLNEQARAGIIPINPEDVAREKEKKLLNRQNLLDARSRVHEYRAGDRSHPDHEKIYALLRGLRQQMKEDGYIPETKFVLHDVDQESKEEALMAHSERLAAAQGFMTSAARAPLRIIKNLRVCGDCHNAFKIISRIVGREIIARDSKRFHHFRDGSCSCNDYW